MLFFNYIELIKAKVSSKTLIHKVLAEQDSQKFFGIKSSLLEQLGKEDS